MYGYDPLHIHDEISMFLTISTKIVLVKTHVYMKLQKPKWYFPKWKLFYKNSSKSCVWVYMNLSNPQTNLSFIFYIKIKSWHLQTWHKSSWKSSLEGLLLLLDLVQTLIQWTRLLLSTWCNLDEWTLESTRANSKTWF